MTKQVTPTVAQHNLHVIITAEQYARLVRYAAQRTLDEGVQVLVGEVVREMIETGLDKSPTRL